jgi:hypothetical protein
MDKTIPNTNTIKKIPTPTTPTPDLNKLPNN